MKQKDINRAIEYLYSKPCTLYDAYNNPSKIKKQIWEDIKISCHADKGHGLKLVSHNSFRFSAAYIFEKNGEEYLKFFHRHRDHYYPPGPLQKGA